MKTIGITGGIGSGKTTCCRIFETLGIPVYYADPRAKKLMTSDKTLKSQIKELLGNEAYFRNGRLNRKFIGSQIFHDKALLKKMNQLVHPAVGRDVIRWASQQDSSYIMYEAALLVENGSYKNFTKLVVVSCPKEERIRRVMARDHVDIKDVNARMKNQLTEKKKVAVADYVIVNDGEELLIPQILKIHHEILGLS